MSDVDPPGRRSQSTRFKKGQSGNPAGRPRKVRPTAPRSAFDVVFDRTLPITQGGERRQVSIDEALGHKTLQDAFAGKRAARREVMRMIEENEKARAAKHGHAPPRVPTFRLEPEDPANAEAALLLLGIACDDPRWSETDPSGRRLLLRPWAVQAALRRRGLAPLDRTDIAKVERCTLQASTLVWPRTRTP